MSYLVTHLVGDGGVTAGPAPPPSIDDDPNARRNTPTSDHRPLAATIVL